MAKLYLPSHIENISRLYHSRIAEAAHAQPGAAVIRCLQAVRHHRPALCIPNDQALVAFIDRIDLIALRHQLHSVICVGLVCRGRPRTPVPFSNHNIMITVSHIGQIQIFAADTKGRRSAPRHRGAQLLPVRAVPAFHGQAGVVFVMGHIQSSRGRICI